MKRAVDRAMHDERPEKRSVRGLWIEAIRSYRAAYPDDAVPLYLTLSGAEGKDIEALINAGILRTTEVGSIHSADQGVAVAIESNARAVLALVEKFPGLKILEQSVDAILHSTKMTTWPVGEHVRFCQARVINLDLNMMLKFENVAGELQFAPLQWIRKLCVLHAEKRLEWCLLLTLHGEVSWESAETKAVAAFLRENFRREASFANMARGALGETLFQKIVDDTIPAAKRLATEDQQLLLMIYVPKRIAHVAQHEGWRVDTKRNLRYGGSGKRAPMVTWILDFRWDARFTTEPDALYRDSLKTLLVGVGTIAEDGTLS